MLYQLSYAPTRRTALFITMESAAFASNPVLVTLSGVEG